MDKNIVALVREDTKTVQVKFFPDVRVVDKNGSVAALDDGDRYMRKTAGKEYTYVTTFNCKMGDLALVFVGERPAIVEIQSVDEVICIQPNEDKEYKWIAAIIETSAYDKLMEQNNAMKAVLAKSYQTTIRRQFRNVFLESTDGDTIKLLDNILKGN